MDLSSKEIVHKEGREVTEQWNKVTSYSATWCNNSYNSKVKTVNLSMFYGCESLYDATCLNNWKINSSVTISQMFSNTKVTALPSWYK